MKRKGAKININSFFIGCIAGILIITAFVFAQTSGSANNANLTIWDGTDNTQIIWKSGDNIFFYANYTNSTSGAVVSDGNCSIRFENSTNDFGGWFNMSFNLSTTQFEYNRTFDYKGTFNFEVNCTNSSSMNINLTDGFTISNTPAEINTNDDGTIDIDGNPSSIDYWQCTEDALCIYNATSNVTEPDTNDVLTFNYSSSSNTTLTNFTLNSSTGILEINITTDTDVGSGDKQIELTVTDTDGPQSNGILKVNITAVNDAPQFQTIQNWSFNMTELFEEIINVTDEENNIPFSLNITFESCSTAEWSTRNSTNCTLFTDSQYTFNETTGVLNISFTPSRNDVGSYIINFTVTDLNNNVTPYNASTTQIANFTVLNINSAPYFRYVCDNERNTTEDSEFNCWINATDIDETSNLTFSSNYTWFAFNGTGSSSISVNVNSSTNFNASALVNFTADDSNVGNWSVNISVTDTGSPAKANSTLIWFFINNVNDSVYLDSISNVTAYTSNNYTIYVNATDDDLLIPDESVYNEVLSFSSNNSNVSVSGSEISGTNKTRATISFNPNDLGLGNHSVNISVNDSNRYSTASRVFVIEVIGNSAPVWNSSTETNHTLTEGTIFYLNLSQNVSDADGDSINFSFSNDTAFPSFTIGETTGIINFTPVDGDVGQHIVTINASDGVASVSLVFNFTVSNVNDNPLIETPITVDNATADSKSNVNASEDNATELYVFVEDDDFRIPSGQRSFYNESLSLNLTIQGPNPNLFSFDSGTFISGNQTRFDATFTPNQSDVGSYNITINISDSSNASSFLSFNLTVFNTPDSPVITEIANLSSSIIENIYLDINATDEDDGNESSGNLTFSIANLTSRGNFLSINSSTGVINFSLNQTYAGVWEYNISVNDSSGSEDSFLWKLTVYDYPKILSPSSGFEFNLKENVSIALNFSVNHSVQDNLNYTLIINNITRNSTAGFGNGTEFIWNFTSNFTDETTCSGAVNLTLNVSNGKLSNSTTWNVTINHTNYPLAFTTTIPDTTSTSLILSNYFTDIDASDSCYNQTVGFTYSLVNGSASGGAITVSISNWTDSGIPSINFSASSSGSANYSIRAYEYSNNSYISGILRNVSSNNFSVSLTVTSTTTTTTTSSSGGGGGSSLTKPISLKIIVPDPVSAKRKDHLVLPIAVVNTGKVDLREIVLTSFVAKNSVLRDDLIASFDNSLISLLRAGERKNLTLIVDINTEEFGFYEVTLNATVKNPKYSDWAKLYINVEESENVEERILFTEEFIVENPRCAELKELVDEAKRYVSEGNIAGAGKKLEEAVEGCKKMIEQQPPVRAKKKIEEYLFNYIGLASVIVFVLGFLYHAYRRRKFRKAEAFKEKFNNDGNLESV